MDLGHEAHIWYSLMERQVAREFEKRGMQIHGGAPMADDATEGGKKVQVDVSDKRGYSADAKKFVEVTFRAARCSTTQAVDLDEAERLYYKLRWLLQDNGRALDAPFVWKVQVRLHADYQVKKNRIGTYFVVARDVDAIKNGLHYISQHRGGVSFLSAEKVINSRGEAVNYGSSAKLQIVHEKVADETAADRKKKPETVVES